MNTARKSLSLQFITCTSLALFIACLAVESASGGIFFNRRARFVPPHHQVQTQTVQTPTRAFRQVSDTTTAQQAPIIRTPNAEVSDEQPAESPDGSKNVLQHTPQPGNEPVITPKLNPQEGVGSGNESPAENDFSPLLTPQPIPQTTTTHVVPVVPHYPPTVVVPRTGVGVYTSPHRTDVHVGPGIGVHTHPSGAVNVRVGRFLNLNIPGYAPAPAAYPGYPSQPIYQTPKAPTRAFRHRHR